MTRCDAPPLAPFRARPPWWGRDLQTARNYLMRDYADLSAWPAENLSFAMDNGDRLGGAYHHPDRASARPTVLLIHGFTGCADSAYVLASAAFLLRHGYPVLRLNLRGAGPTRRDCREIYHAGRSEDLRAVVAQLPQAVRHRGLAAVGFSLGGNMLLKYLGEVGVSAPFAAAVAVSAPIDLALAIRRMAAPRNWLYHRWLVANTRRDWLAGPSTLDSRQRATVRRVRSLYALDDAVVGPLNGFAGADDYYERCAAKGFLASVRVPTLVIHAADDPWIPVAMYRKIDWAANERLSALITRGGGHVGFHDRAGRRHDREVVGFFERRCA